MLTQRALGNPEVSGRPSAVAIRRADLISGLLLASAFAVARWVNIRGDRREWLSMMLFAVAVRAMPATAALIDASDLLRAGADDPAGRA